jgi:phage N-6-adenine-methyltransferase
MTTWSPFFSYYGGKWRVARKYPAPKYTTVIEPFCGSAGYSLSYTRAQVTLCDVDSNIAGIWQYLKRATPQDIMAIPDVPPGGTVNDLPVCQEAKWLVGFWLSRGVERPRPTPSKWMIDGKAKRPGSYWGPQVRQRIAQQLHVIRDWTILSCSYLELPNTESTWFIDPPYVVSGRRYRCGSSGIDYAELSDWCKTRKGQVIVCEQEGADWLPFQPLTDIKTQRTKRSREMIWTTENKSSPWNVIHSSNDMAWRTPQRLFDQLDKEFDFELDAAASSANALCPQYFTEEDDALTQDWSGYQSVWCNPPYGRELHRWLRKAHTESRKGPTVVMLVMACTETKWWREHAWRADEIRFIQGRVKFARSTGELAGAAPKGSAVIIFHSQWDGPPRVTLMNQ